MRIVITRRMRLDYRDGINIFIFALGQAMIRHGHEVTVVATHLGALDRLRPIFGVLELPNIQAVEAARARISVEGLSPRWLIRGRRLISSYSPDLVINNGALPFRVPGYSCNLAHDLGWASAPRRLDVLRRAYKRYAYRRCDAVVALSSEVRHGLAGDLGMRAERILLIPPCVDVEAIKKTRSERREDAIIHTGTDAYKNPTATIRAFAQLRRPRTKLYVEGPTNPDLERDITSLPAAVKSRIELVGELGASAMSRLLGSVRVASFPTRYIVPTASATVVEAIAAGTPIAGSRVISVDLLRDGYNGLVGDSEEGLAHAFDRLLEDDELWQAQSTAAASMAMRFSSDAVAETYLSLARATVGEATSTI